MGVKTGKEAVSHKVIVIKGGARPTCNSCTILSIEVCVNLGRLADQFE